MDAIQFTQQAISNAELNAFLNEIADDANNRIANEEPQQYSIGIETVLIGAASYALFYCLKNYFDRQRGFNDTEVVKKQAQLIEDLIKSGIKPQQAQAIVISLLDRIAKRNANDPLLKTALGFINKDK